MRNYRSIPTRFHSHSKYMLTIYTSTTKLIDTFDPNPMKMKLGHSYKKCLWNSTTFHNIAWDHHFHIINNMPKTFKRISLRFIYHRLLKGKMQYTHDHRCPHCQLIFDTNTPHDHFLQFYLTAIEKNNVSIQLKRSWIENSLPKN